MNGFKLIEEWIIRFLLIVDGIISLRMNWSYGVGMLRWSCLYYF